VKADSAALMLTLDAAYIAQQLPFYSVEMCVVSGESLDEDAIDVLYGNTLVRLCCKGCQRKFSKDPEAFMKKLGDAEKPNHKAENHDTDHDKSDRGHDGDRDG
jgi:hypothetical protein